MLLKIDTRKLRRKGAMCAGSLDTYPKTATTVRIKQSTEQGRAENSKKDNNKGSLNKKANYVSEDKVDYATFHAFNASTCQKLEDDTWIIDSGCTSHMTFNKDYFIDFKPIKGRVYLAGRNNVVESKGIGSIKVKVQNDKDITKYVIIYDVVYVPDLRNNLLSIMKLMNRGLRVNFSNHTAKICEQNSSEVIAVGERMNDHFIIKMTPIPVHNNEVCNNTQIKNQTVSETTTEMFNMNIEEKWHRRLGHVNNKYIKNIKLKE